MDKTYRLLPCCHHLGNVPSVQHQQWIITIIVQKGTRLFLLPASIWLHLFECEKNQDGCNMIQACGLKQWLRFVLWIWWAALLLMHFSEQYSVELNLNLNRCNIYNSEILNVFAQPEVSCSSSIYTTHFSQVKWFWLFVLRSRVFVCLFLPFICCFGVLLINCNLLKLENGRSILSVSNIADCELSRNHDIIWHCGRVGRFVSKSTLNQLLPPIM